MGIWIIARICIRESEYVCGHKNLEFRLGKAIWEEHEYKTLTQMDHLSLNRHVA